MRKISILVLFLLFFITNVTAESTVYSPTTQFFVNDFANILSDKTEQEIFNIGRTIQEKTTAN